MQIPVVTPAVRRINRMVFPGAQRSVHRPDVDRGLRAGESRLEALTSRDEPVAVVHRPGTEAVRHTLFLYGNAMNLTDTPPIRAVLASNGASVTCFDYLGYGLSPGLPTEGGCYRAAHAALSLLETALGAAPGSVDVVGWSLGSAVSLHLASHRAVRRLVLMSPFAGVAPFVLGQGGLQHTPLRRTPLRRLGPFAGANRVGDISCPTLLITGDADTLTPSWMAEDLAAGLRGPAELVRIPGAGHNDLFSQRIVWKQLLAFLTTDTPA